MTDKTIPFEEIKTDLNLELLDNIRIIDESHPDTISIELTLLSSKKPNTVKEYKIFIDYYQMDELENLERPTKEVCGWDNETQVAWLVVLECEKKEMVRNIEKIVEWHNQEIRRIRKMIETNNILRTNYDTENPRGDLIRTDYAPYAPGKPASRDIDYQEVTIPMLDYLKMAYITEIESSNFLTIILETIPLHTIQRPTFEDYIELKKFIADHYPTNKFKNHMGKDVTITFDKEEEEITLKIYCQEWKFNEKRIDQTIEKAMIWNYTEIQKLYTSFQQS